MSFIPTFMCKLQGVKFNKRSDHCVGRTLEHRSSWDHVQLGSYSIQPGLNHGQHYGETFLFFHHLLQSLMSNSKTTGLLHKCSQIKLCKLIDALAAINRIDTLFSLHMLEIEKRLYRGKTEKKKIYLCHLKKK